MFAGSYQGVARLCAKVVLAFTLLSLTACGSSPTSPTTSSSGSKATFLIVFAPVGGSYTAQFNNQTYTAQGGFQVQLAAGTYQVAGSFVGQGFGVAFTALSGGGAVSGSMQSLSGPSPTVQPCQVVYLNNGSLLQQQNFSMQFQVTTNVNSACQ